MTDHEQENFAASLRRIKPGPLPEDLRERLLAAEPRRSATTTDAPRLGAVGPGLARLWQWLIPATAMLLCAAAIWRAGHSSTRTRSETTTPPATTHPGLEADTVELSHEFLSSFDAVATLPSGEPVRFRCEQWQNKVTLKDREQGLLVENWSPQIVVVPVRFESY